jgi:hypothetical protein
MFKGSERVLPHWRMRQCSGSSCGIATPRAASNTRDCTSSVGGVHARVHAHVQCSPAAAPSKRSTFPPALRNCVTLATQPRAGVRGPSPGSAKDGFSSKLSLSVERTTTADAPIAAPTKSRARIAMDGPRTHVKVHACGQWHVCDCTIPQTDSSFKVCRSLNLLTRRLPTWGPGATGERRRARGRCTPPTLPALAYAPDVPAVDRISPLIESLFLSLAHAVCCTFSCKSTQIHHAWQ